MLPYFERMADENQSILFAKVDYDTAKGVITENQIRSFPTIYFFKGGRKVGEVVGADIQKIELLLKRLRV